MRWLISTLLQAHFALGVVHDWSIYARQSNYLVAPEVPTYTIELPVDHFNTSNKATFSNRYFVNDTYYKEGGPVILFNFGESTASKRVVSHFLADFYGKPGDVKSSVLALARELNGFVVGWEHRYYGQSLVVEHDNIIGVPINGASGYAYLTVDQAIEDMVSFANNFNKTKLNKNENVRDPKNLDPYHSAWIIMGGSYPGSLSAWSRQKHPEVFYAAWSSSAPMQTMEDGSIYYNAYARYMPQNCTNDLEVITKFIDDGFKAGNANAMHTLSQTLGMIRNNGDNAPIYESPVRLANAVARAITFSDFGGYQRLGPLHTTRPMCDYMQTFDGDQYLRDVAKARNFGAVVGVAFKNPGGAKFSDKGIAESYGEKGGIVAWNALMFGLWKANKEVSKFWSNWPPAPVDDTEHAWDTRSWEWQVRTELGWWQGSNSSNEYQIVSNALNLSAVRDWFFDPRNTIFSDVPKTINDTELLKLGGWNIKVSNVMFGVGEQDPWRAFSVATEEQAYGAPKRTVTTNVPKCNEAPTGSDVFGIVYPAAMHVEDMLTVPWLYEHSQKKTPVQQGVDLFTKAWKTWQPCFNQSRDDLRNAKVDNGQGKGAAGQDKDDDSSSSNGNTDSGRSEGGSGGEEGGSRIASSLNMGLAMLMAILVILLTF